MSKIAIVGLGLIGGSIGLALKHAGGNNELVGHDRDPETAGRAKRAGAVDRVEWSLPLAVEGAALVIIATPPGEVLEAIRTMAPNLSPGSVLTDTASTKVEILQQVVELLPEGVSFVGGHPMAGKERSGIEEAQADLFVGSTYCVLPSRRADDQAVDTVLQLVNAVGAQPLFLDPVEHDSFVAAISHLPYLVASALVRTSSSTPGWRDISRLAAGGFRDASRIASANSAMYRDICLSNRESILHWLDRYMEVLQRYRSLIEASDGAALTEEFHKAKTARDEWLAEREGRAIPRDGDDGMDAGDGLRQMFIGSWASKRIKGN